MRIKSKSLSQMFIREKRIPSNDETPEFLLSPSGVIFITGRSFKINSIIQNDLIEWFSGYMMVAAEKTYINIYLEYLSNESRMQILDLLSEILAILEDETVVINWFYDKGDDDILEEGEYLSEALNFPFDFILNRFEKPFPPNFMPHEKMSHR